MTVLSRIVNDTTDWLAEASGFVAVVLSVAAAAIMLLNVGGLVENIMALPR